MSRSATARRLAAVCATAAAFTVIAALPASATVVTSGYDTSNSTGTIGPSAGTGHAITRDQIIARAEDWVANQVNYSTTEGWSDGAVGGPYRMDCSGFVSMAWGLSTSMVTSTLPSVATVIPTSQLQPGDALDYTAEHAVIFAKWVDQSAGTFDYYYESSGSNRTIEAEGNFNDGTLDSWPTADYEALRYNDLTTSTTTPTGTVGTVYDNTRLTSGSWSGSKASDGGGNVSRTALVGRPDGSMEMFTLANGDVWENTLSGGAWSGAKIMDGNGAITGLAAGVLPNGTVHLATIAQGEVYDNTQNSNGSWAGAQLVDANGSITAVALAALPSGVLHLETLAKGVVFDNSLNSNGSWGGAKTVDASGTITAIAAAALPTGVLHLETDSKGEVYDNALGTNGSWGGAKLVDANGSITAVAAAAPGGVLHLETLAKGVVFDNSLNSNGSWSGAKTVDANGAISWISATALPDGTMHLETIAP